MKLPRSGGELTKVLVLGGAGPFGKGVAQALAKSDRISELRIAGRRLGSTEAAAKEIGPKGTALALDATDTTALTSALKGTELLVNVAGPEWVTVLPALRAAIQAGVHYADIAADGPTAEQAFGMNRAAKNAGVAAITGIGSCPGITNLLMVHAGRQFDEITEVTCYEYFPVHEGAWLDSMRISKEIQETGRVDGSLQMMVRWAGGPARSFEGGRWVDLDPMSTQWPATLSGGGEIRVHPCCGIETLTVPQALPGATTVRVASCLFPPSVDRLYLEAGRRMATGRVDPANVTREFFEAATREAPKWPPWASQYPRNVEVWVEASGLKTGRPGRVRISPADALLSAQGALAVASLRILDGRCERRGVFTVEACFEPMPFFEEVARFRGEFPSDGRLLDTRWEWG